jgi:hypothetical protein
VGADAVAGAEGNTAAPRSRAVCPNGLVPRSRRGRRARHAREGSPGTWEAQLSPPLGVVPPSEGKRSAVEWTAGNPSTS